MKTNTQSKSEIMLFAGIDFHKRYNVVHVVDSSATPLYPWPSGGAGAEGLKKGILISQ